MTRHLHIVHALILGTAFGLAISAGAAHADNISFVSTAGSDANACTSAAPCRTLQRAIDVTSEGGEVRIVDSGLFGNRTRIRKSLTIVGGGNTVLLGNPIVVRAAGAVVALRGLTLNGRGKFVTGIFVEEAATVHIEDCLIHGFGFNGILVESGDIQVFVIDTTVRDSDTGLGVRTGNLVRISNSTVTANGVGVRLSAGATVETRGNNTIRGNEDDVTGPLTPFAGL